MLLIYFQRSGFSLDGSHFFLEFVMIVSSPFSELAPKWRRGALWPTFVKSILVGSSFLSYFDPLGLLAQTHLS